MCGYMHVPVAYTVWIQVTGKRNSNNLCKFNAKQFCHFFVRSQTATSQPRPRPVCARFKMAGV